MRQCYRKNNAINGKTFPFLNKPPGVILVFLIIPSSTRWQSGALIIIPRNRLWNNLNSGVDRRMIIDLQLPKAFMVFEVKEEGESAGRWQIRCCWTTHQTSPRLSGSNVTKTRFMFPLNLSGSAVCFCRWREQTVKPADRTLGWFPSWIGGFCFFCDGFRWTLVYEQNRGLLSLAACHIVTFVPTWQMSGSLFYPMLGVLEENNWGSVPE